MGTYNRSMTGGSLVSHFKECPDKVLQHKDLVGLSQRIETVPAR